MLRLITRRVGDADRPALERDGRVADVDAPSVRALLARGPGAVDDAVAAALDVLDRGDGEDLAAVRLRPPVPDPGKILCLGLNYAAHAAEGPFELPPAPTLFGKFANSLIASGDPIVIPPATAKVDYEAELAVVIGRRCKDVPEDEALSVIAGYAAFNDVSARDLQRLTPQWVAGKAVDTFGPLGPGLALASEVGDPQALAIATRVNGVTLQSDTTANMVFRIAPTIAFITSFMTLEPGDIIATGTPSGVGYARTPPVLLGPGDVVEVEIERVGRIENPVVLEGAA